MGEDAAFAPDALEPIGIFLTYPFLIATTGDAPYSTMEELAAYSAENEVTLGHFGYGLEPTLMDLPGHGRTWRRLQRGSGV